MPTSQRGQAAHAHECALQARAVFIYVERVLSLPPHLWGPYAQVGVFLRGKGRKGGGTVGDSSLRGMLVLLIVSLIGRGQGEADLDGSNRIAHEGIGYKGVLHDKS